MARGDGFSWGVSLKLPPSLELVTPSSCIARNQLQSNPFPPSTAVECRTSYEFTAACFSCTPVGSWRHLAGTCTVRCHCSRGTFLPSACTVRGGEHPHGSPKSHTPELSPYRDLIFTAISSPHVQPLSGGSEHILLVASFQLQRILIPPPRLCSLPSAYHPIKPFPLHTSNEESETWCCPRRNLSVTNLICSFHYFSVSYSLHISLRLADQSHRIDTSFAITVKELYYRT
jgi:hypothetical protein